MEQYVLLPLGSFVPSLDTLLNGINYTIGINNGEVIYVSTRDKNFSVRGKIGVGSSIKEANIPLGEIKMIPGWGYYSKIDNIWYAGFLVENPKNDSMKIGWMFKYNFPSEYSARWSSPLLLGL